MVAGLDDSEVQQTWRGSGILDEGEFQDRLKVFMTVDRLELKMRNRKL